MRRPQRPRENQTMAEPSSNRSLVMSDSASRRRATARVFGQTTLLLITCASVIILLFIFYFTGRDAYPFFSNATIHTFPFHPGTVSAADVDRQPILRPWAGAGEVRFWTALVPLDYAGPLAEAFSKAGVQTIAEPVPEVGGENVSALAVYLREDSLAKDPAVLGQLLAEVGRQTARQVPRTRFRQVTGEGSNGTAAADLSETAVFRLVFRESEPLRVSLKRAGEFFGGTHYNPTMEPPQFGALSFFYGSLMVTLGAILIAVPLGIAAAVCLSDVLPFAVRQWVKPVIEIIAAIPSVAYGFFALVVFAPLLQRMGGKLICGTLLVIGIPLVLLTAVVAAELVVDRLRVSLRGATTVVFTVFATLGGLALFAAAHGALGLQIASGTNALNVSIILGIMALPTIVSVSEDALQAVPRAIREGSYGLGATRAETMLLTVIPSAMSGIVAAVILGIMRAVGETMVVWMAAGNARAIPQPFYNYLAPIRTLTATIAGDMGEADQSTGSLRYHVLFAMAFCLLTISFAMNLASEWVVRRQRRKLEGL